MKVSHIQLETCVECGYYCTEAAQSLCRDCMRASKQWSDAKLETVQHRIWTRFQERKKQSALSVEARADATKSAIEEIKKWTNTRR